MGAGAALSPMRGAAGIAGRLGAFRHSAGARLTVIAYAVIAVVTIAPVILAGPRVYPIDFYYFWAAGSLWLDGANPYGEAFAQFFSQYPDIHDENAVRPFFYPPNAILLFGPLGMFGMNGAWWCASLMNLAALGLSSFLFARLARRLAFAETLLYPALLHFSVLSIGWSIGKILFMFSQPMHVFYAAFLMVLVGALEKRRALMIAGLVICLIKPNLGLPVAAACLLSRETRLPAVIAGAATGALALAGLACSGFAPETLLATLHDFLANIGLYATFPENSPARQSGANYLLFRLGGASLSPFVWLAVTLGATGLAAFRLVDRRDPETRSAALIIFAMAAALFFIPAHNNYFLPAGAVVVWLFRYGRAGALLAAAGYVLLMRAYALALGAVSDNVMHPVINIAALCTLAGALIFVAACWRMLQPPRAGRAGGPELRHDGNA